jgi:hypothetical protein
MSDVKYDRHYREDPAACGSPFAEFEAFCREAAVGSVLEERGWSLPRVTQNRLIAQRPAS